jgi:hypothetical protein
MNDLDMHVGSRAALQPAYEHALHRLLRSPSVQA